MVTTLKSALKGLLEGELKVTRAFESLKVYEAWQRAAGEKLAKNAAFETFHEGILTIGIKNSSWAQQVTMMKRRLLELLKNEIGSSLVKDIRVKSSSDDVSRERTATKKNCVLCGVEFSSQGDELCPICSRMNLEQDLYKVYRLLNKEPKLTYKEAKSLVSGITESAFKRAKRNLKEYKIDLLVIERRSRGKKIGKTGSN
jgi:hypothetical protein